VTPDTTLNDIANDIKPLEQICEKCPEKHKTAAMHLKNDTANSVSRSQICPSTLPEALNEVG